MAPGVSAISNENDVTRSTSGSVLNHKSSLNSYVHQIPGYKEKPVYELMTQTGPSHDPVFSVRCTLPQVGVGLDVSSTVGVGKSKKAAEAEAARLMLLLVKEGHKQSRQFVSRDIEGNILLGDCAEPGIAHFVRLQKLTGFNLFS